MSFTPEALFSVLEDLDSAAGYLVAYSGGVDSHVLLHAVSALRDRLSAPIRAVHVNHGLSPRAGEWMQHCRRVCEDLSIELSCFDIDAAAPPGESQEAWSRQQRYDIFNRIIGENEILLTAHQADDQAETLLLQLIRGGGPAGLAAMPANRKLGRGRHVRPLLDFDRQSLTDYARVHGLQWVEDDSNAETRFDRNYLRRRVMPPLGERWPAVTGTLGRAAAIQAETADLLSQLGALDMEVCYEPVTRSLDTGRVKALPLARQRNLLRFWLRQLGHETPDSRRLEAIINEVMHARADAGPCVEWSGVQVRRFQGRLFAVSPLPAVSEFQEQEWNLTRPATLPLGELHATRDRGRGIRASACPDGRLSIRFRRGGEKLRLPGRSHRQELKKLYQEYGVPPWLRDLIPLLYVGDRLAAVADAWFERDFVAGPEEEAWVIRWSEAEKAFGQGTTSESGVRVLNGNRTE